MTRPAKTPAFTTTVDPTTVIGATVTIILGFHPGMVMVAVKVPAIIKAFRKFVEDNIRGEIEAVVGAAGGRLLAISNEKGENL